MINNDIFRRLRYTFNYNNGQLVAIFAQVNEKVSTSQLDGWLSKEEESSFVLMNDKALACFLNGLINEKRGSNGKPQRAPETELNNNLILQKLKIALKLESDDIIALLAQVNFTLSKHELSAFFRKPDHKHFRFCKDQVLRNFLSGLQAQNAGKSDNSKRQSKNDNAHNKAHNKPHDNEKSVPNVSAAKSTSNTKSKTKTAKIYVNPNASKNKPEPKRKVLKISPKEIWKNSE